MFQIDEESIKSRANIKVVGIGGGGSNAIKTMYQSGLKGVQFIAANTDIQALEEHENLDCIVQMGAQLTRGLGAGANPEIGRQAAIESCDKIVDALKGADMVFITAGMGGGTGTGASGVVARIAKEQGALTIGVVTRPFFFEGQRRARHAEMGIRFLKENVDTLIVIPNQKLLKTTNENASLLTAFKSVDNILLQAVQGIVNLINEKGLINLDFADIKTVMSEKGLAIIGTGAAKGEERALTAGSMAISSPLLEDTSFKGALGLIINITGGPDLSLKEVNQAAELITAEAHSDAEIIFGAIVDPDDSSKEVKITVIATGFESSETKEKRSNQTSQLEPQHHIKTKDNGDTSTSTHLSNEKDRTQTPPLSSDRKEAPNNEQSTKKLPKDILMEKARAYQAQLLKQKQEKPHQQLSMGINEEVKPITKLKQKPPFAKHRSDLMSLFKKSEKTLF
ncbi:MAG: cell division protein FtsZ [Bdellovibrionales bacterium]|nr:cell division protein FtsZ [Bdellovibrionales bacterium]